VKPDENNFDVRPNDSYNSIEIKRTWYNRELTHCRNDNYDRLEQFLLSLRQFLIYGVDRNRQEEQLAGKHAGPGMLSLKTHVHSSKWRKQLCACCL